MKVVLVGGSGFIGRALRTRLIADGHEAIVLGRDRSQVHDGWRQVHWDARTLGEWVSSLEGADAVVHLAGKRVDCRPTRANVDELISSRADTVRLVGRAVQELNTQPKAWIQLSSLAIFGDSGERVIDENTEPPQNGPRQQVEVCRQWERAFADATSHSSIERTVLLRPAIGIGGADDPASRQLLRLARFGLGGKVSSGDQWVSWIAADDLFKLIYRTVVDESMHGLYHLASPNPIRNHEFIAAYRSAAGSKFGLPSPAPIVKMGAWLMGSDPALALTGRRCIPQRLLDEGYEFQTDIGVAVRNAAEAARLDD